MIRKMLVVAAAIAMPAVAVAGASAVSGAGIASAKALPPVPVTCSLSGSVTFAKPGLSHSGSLTKKTVETTKTAITPAGPAACGTKAIKNKINSTPGVCATDPSPAPICASAPAKTLAKDPNFYDSTASLLSSPASILTSLAGGVKTTDNGTKITLIPKTSGAIVPGGACGASEVGFNVTGTVTGGGAVTAFALNICLGTDTGTGGTTGVFFPDYIAASGGGSQVIASAGVDGATSSLTLS